MQARIVATGRGARWLAEGWAMFRVAPLGWTALAFAYGFLMMVMSAVPLIGPAAFLVLYPAFTVGLMAAARAASRGAPVEMSLLFDGFRNNLRAQIVLGALYLVGSIVVFAGMMLADEGNVLRTMLTGRNPEEVHVTDLVTPLGVMTLLYAPMLMMFWFAPPLAAWHGVGALKALFFSFFACLMNWRALLVYSATVMAAIVGLAALLLLASALLAGAAGRPVPPPVVLVVVILFFPTLFGSFYASYRDVFGPSTDPAP
jgi:hypothetical protein